ncbi:peptidoglycan/LPS O-acetylase OafA/YrhL [Bradyrhizobium sp. CIR48]|nr:peptidoglycan/LPS O-acetylase OafA/YrhL [Bradyrhizobium sp. CIR48]
MGSIVGWVHIYLPGVFENRPPPNYVNGSIWTIPYELKCYAVIAALGIAGLTKKPGLFTSLAILAMLAFSAKGVTSPSYGVSHGEMILPFMFGVAIYLVRNMLPFSLALFVLSFTLSLVLFSCNSMSYLEAPFVAYSTIYIWGYSTQRECDGCAVPIIHTVSTFTASHSNRRRSNCFQAGASGC